eukprot:364477-Chlamydomonas_euryale.AAC.4
MQHRMAHGMVHGMAHHAPCHDHAAQSSQPAASWSERAVPDVGGLSCRLSARVACMLLGAYHHWTPAATKLRL